MGLDMYMYKVDRLAESEAARLNQMDSDDVGGCYSPYHYIRKDVVDENPEPYSDLIPFFRQVKLLTQEFNYAKCFKDHHIHPNEEIVGSHQSSKSIGFLFANGHRLELSDDEFEKYIDSVDRDFYIWKAEEVAYWRKAYDLHDFLETSRILIRGHQMRKNGTNPTEEDLHNWTTANCGYYLLSEEEKQALENYLHDRDMEPIDELHAQSANLFYHAWW
jgi:hypothetical protein